MISNPVKYSIFFLFTAFILFSCKRSSVFEDKVEFENEIWDASKAAEFKVDIENPETPCNVFIEFENTKNYLSSNLWLMIHVISPSGKVQNERTEFILTEQNGKWLGKIHRNSVENKFPFKNNIHFPEKGIYTFRISQIMRENFTPRAVSVGISIEESK
jgi:gliding motility-associated lipoprotein GldH